MFFYEAENLFDSTFVYIPHHHMWGWSTGHRYIEVLF